MVHKKGRLHYKSNTLTVSIVFQTTSDVLNYGTENLGAHIYKIS